MKAIKCKICGKEHYGPCFVRTEGRSGSAVDEREHVSTIKAARPNHGRSILVRHAENDAGSSKQVREPKLAPTKARDAKSDVASPAPRPRKVGRPKTASGPTFDKREYQRQYMVAWRAKLKASKSNPNTPERNDE